MSKNFWIILVVTILAFVGVFFLLNSDNGADETQTANVLEIQESDHTKGLDGAPVSVIEYADFQCPACGALFPVVSQMETEFGNQVEFVFRHFPLTAIHPNTMAAHRAAEAAGNQGKFWEMHDLLYQRQQSWAASSNVTSIMESYAQELNLDMDTYRTDVSSENTSKVINADIDSGRSVGVQGTPTFFVAGVKISTPQSVEEFRNAIQSAIDEANSPSQENQTP